MVTWLSSCSLTSWLMMITEKKKFLRMLFGTVLLLLGCKHMCALYSTMGTWCLANGTSRKLWQSWPIYFITQGTGDRGMDMGETTWLDVGHCQDSSFYLGRGNKYIISNVLYYYKGIILCFAFPPSTKSRRAPLKGTYFLFKCHLHELCLVLQVLIAPLHGMLIYDCCLKSI